MLNKLYYIVIIVLVILTSCYKETPAPQSSVILAMSANHASIPADGVSKQLITLELPDKTTDATNSIVFNTTKGLFDIAAKNTITVSAQNVMINGKLNKIATVYLISSGDEGIAYVTATIKNYTQTDTINFIRAYSDQIHLYVDKLNYQNGNGTEVTITVQCRKNPGSGTPSIGQAITLSARDSTQKPIGIFRNLNLLTDASGNCINYFSMPSGSTYVGKIYLTASVVNDPSGMSISDATTINFYK